MLRTRKDLAACITYAGVKYLEVEVHVGSDGRVGRVDLTRVHPRRPRLSRCLYPLLTARFMRLGCRWSFRYTWAGFF
jgi:hypothetical protein